MASREENIREILPTRWFIHGKKITPLKAIRLKCLECMAGHPKAVKLCSSKECPLYFFRFGKNPNRKGIGGNSFPKKK